MEVRYYDIVGNRLHTDYDDLRLNPGIPHLTEHGGVAEIEIDAKLKTVTFRQDGITNRYNNVIFRVDRSFKDYEFGFKRLSLGGVEFIVSKDFALNSVTHISYVTPESVQSDIKDRIESNGYIY